MNWVSSLLSDQSLPLLSYQANARDYSQWTVIANCGLSIPNRNEHLILDT